VTINDYSIGGYWCLLIDIILVAIILVDIGGYKWLFFVIILMIIGGYFIKSY
jgi:hypothetical protein